MDGMLSQEEINALLNGMNTDDDLGSDTQQLEEEQSSQETVNKSALSDTEKDAVGEISNISMGTAATTLSSLLNQKVNITTPTVDITSWKELSSRYNRPCVLMQISYKEGIDGNNVLILKESDVNIITDLMMGGVGQVDAEAPLSELQLSAIGEAMNQMMGSAATSMSSMFNRKIDISPPLADLVETNSDIDEEMPKFLKHSFVMVAFKMQIGNLIDSEIMQLYPIAFARDLLKMFMPEEVTPVQPKQSAPAMQPAYQEMPVQASQGYAQQPMANAYGQSSQGYAQPVQQQPNVNVAPAAFQPFVDNVTTFTQPENIDLIMDVPLNVTVELGRTSKSIKDILKFSPGTIVELNKIAGEAVDVLVNGKNVAKGEVVVIEENFGVRITEIIKE